MVAHAVEHAGVTVVLVDDHEWVREGIKSVHGQAPDMKVVGESADSLDAISVIERSQPDVALVDMHLRESAAWTS